MNRPSAIARLTALSASAAITFAIVNGLASYAWPGDNGTRLIVEAAAVQTKVMVQQTDTPHAPADQGQNLTPRTTR